MRKEILKILPEIRKIKNSELREKVIAAWVEGIRLGSWEMEDLKKIPFTLLISDSKVNLIEHTRAVTNTALKIAEVVSKAYGNSVKLDKDVLLAGGILHDVGKLLEYAKVKGEISKSGKGKFLRHPFSGTALAYKFGIPDEVLHLIAAHSHEGDEGYRSIEAIIIHHADFINFEVLGGKT
ncbi:MAG TPA: HD domain-containing protein [Terriglobales bacterium]|nr:HD domain-containing protein [Terriglobales bacterium]